MKTLIGSPEQCRRRAARRCAVASRALGPSARTRAVADAPRAHSLAERGLRVTISAPAAEATTGLDPTARRTLDRLLERIAAQAAPGTALDVQVSLTRDAVRAAVSYVHAGTAAEPACHPMQEYWSWAATRTDVIPDDRSGAETGATHRDVVH